MCFCHRAEAKATDLVRRPRRGEKKRSASQLEKELSKTRYESKIVISFASLPVNIAGCYDGVVMSRRHSLLTYC